MRKLQTTWLVPVAIAALAIFAAGPAAARTCDLDTVPAATLLLPYFEVDVSGASLRAADTVFAILNTDSIRHRIVHVTLWTEWAIPTAGFNVVLGPNDEQSVNLIDLFTDGAPATHPIAGCWGSPRPGALHFNSALPVTGTLATDLVTLQKAHTGEVFNTPTGGEVASAFHPGLAKGYITFDVVRKCTSLFPSSPRNSGYFRDGGKGIATNDNVLVGDYFLVDNLLAAAAGEPMVHIRADKTFTPGYYTFYGRYVAGSAIDDRQPLGNAYASRFWTTFPGNPALNPRTDLIVWRDTKRGAPAPVLAGAGNPPGIPIPLNDFLCCDEEENCYEYPSSSDLPLAAQRIRVGESIDVPYGSGWMLLDLNHSAASLFSTEAQGYVVTIFRANAVAGEVGASFRAARLGTPCKP